MLALFTSRELPALGFENTAVGMREILMGGAVTAIADYPAAVYWNPAGMIDQENQAWRYNVYTYVNKAHFEYSAEYDNGEIFRDETTSAGDSIAIIPSAFATKSWDHWALGFGLYVPYAGGGAFYRDFQNTGQELEAAAGFPAWTLAGGYRVNDRLSVGAGISVYSGLLEYNNLYQFNPATSTPEQNIIPYEGDYKDAYVGNGGHIGVLYKIDDHWNIGLVYRSEVAIEMAGEEVLAGFSSDSIARFTFPERLDLGLSYRADRMQIGFRASHQTYGDLDEFQFTLLQSVPTSYEDSWSYTVGASYKLNDRLDLLTGYRYIEANRASEAQNPAFIDTDIQTISAGVSYRLRSGTELQFGYQPGFYRTAKHRRQSFDGGSNTFFFAVVF